MPPEPFLLLNKHHPVSRETFDRLKNYHDLLIKWQARINLVSKDSLDNIWQRHFLDSLQLIKMISLPDTVKIMDMGSGAGFPGMVLAIAGIKNMHLVESDGKKVAFLKEVARITHTDVSVHQERAEKNSLDKMNVIIARALSNVATLLSYAESNVSHETICLFPKGKNYAMELEDAKKEWSFDCEVIPSVTDSQGVILKLSNLKRWAHDTNRKS